MDKSTSTTVRPLTQRKAWTPDELARLERLAYGSNNAKDLVREFPDRTLEAIRTKLTHLRSTLNVSCMRESVVMAGPTMLDPEDDGLPDNWQQRQRIRNERDNQRFLAALAALAA